MLKKKRKLLLPKVETNFSWLEEKEPKTPPTTTRLQMTQPSMVSCTCYEKEEQSGWKLGNYWCSYMKKDLSTCLKSSALDRKYQGKNTAFFFDVTILCSFFNFIYCWTKVLRTYSHYCLKLPGKTLPGLTVSLTFNYKRCRMLFH